MKINNALLINKLHPIMSGNGLCPKKSKKIDRKKYKNRFTYGYSANFNYFFLFRKSVYLFLMRIAVGLDTSILSINVFVSGKP